MKQLITTLQIIQMVVGATFAFLHLFVGYTIPVSVPYVYSLADLTSNLSSDVRSALPSATLASATAGLGSWLKKLAFRAAGEEGLAENVRNEAGELFGIDALHAASDLKARQEIRYRDETQMIHCTDTSGQVAAILINCLYLAPLTWLFVRFFVDAYTKKKGVEEKHGLASGRPRRQSVQEAGKEATTNVKRELNRAIEKTVKAEAKPNAQNSRQSGEQNRAVPQEQEAEVLESAEVVTDALDKSVDSAKSKSKQRGG